MKGKVYINEIKYLKFEDYRNIIKNSILSNLGNLLTCIRDRTRFIRERRYENHPIRHIFPFIVFGDFPG